EVMTWAMNAPWSREFFRQLTEVRMAVEPRAAALAARNATVAELDEIVHRYEDMERALGDEKAWADADVKFHQVMVRATHNDLMISLLQIFQNALINSRMATVQVLKQEAMARGQSPSDIILALHGAVLQGILKHDPDEAQSAMQALLEAVDRLVSHVEPEKAEKFTQPS
ncbi:FadR/GntR family transcriptional regulator, partial [Methylacidiphilum caldifontis]|uniref:FadR/GntR family transcriptional regulator n=1 Tax=Methylacidiphilum caldifontis TaxID=2795386 RepID=UPI00106D6F34